MNVEDAWSLPVDCKTRFDIQLENKNTLAIVAVYYFYLYKQNSLSRKKLTTEKKIFHRPKHKKQNIITF